MTDDVGRKTVAFVDVHARIIGYHQFSCQYPRRTSFVLPRTDSRLAQIHVQNRG